MQRDLETLLLELKSISRTMAPFDSEEGRSEEDRRWVDSLSNAEIELLVDWLAGDPVSYCEAADWPEWWYNTMLWDACRLIGEAARLRSEPFLLQRLHGMLVEPRSIEFAKDVIRVWGSETVVPMLRSLAGVVDGEALKRIADCLIEVKHPDSIALLEEMASRHKADHSLYVYLRVAIAEQGEPKTF